MKTVIIFALLAYASIGSANPTCIAQRGIRQPGVKQPNNIVTYAYEYKDIELTGETTFTGDYMVQVKPLPGNKIMLTVHRYMGGNYTEHGSSLSALPVSLSVDVEGGFIRVSCQ